MKECIMNKNQKKFDLETEFIPHLQELAMVAKSGDNSGIKIMVFEYMDPKSHKSFVESMT